MTAAHYFRRSRPAGSRRRSLLWLIPLMVLWIVLIYWQPFIPGERRSDLGNTS